MAATLSTSKSKMILNFLNEAGNEFSEEAILAGELTPVFFGSALTNFGVQTFLETFLKFAPEPHGHKKTDGEIVDPYDKDFSGFVFKIQANMDPRHRDRIAFVRIVSGEFERGMSVNLSRTGKGAKLSNVTQFMAESRENVTNAVAGDIIGVYDTGTYQVGDTLTVGKNKFEFEPLPTFTPEIFMKVSAKNVMKQKSFHKGIEQLVQEGAVQLYKNYQTGEYMLGAVGQLQFEVFKHRMEGEYNAEVGYDSKWVKRLFVGSSLRTWMNGCHQAEISWLKTALINQSSSSKMTLPFAGLQISIQT